VWISRVKSGVFFCLRHHGNRHPHICASLPCPLKYVTNSGYITSIYSASDVWICVGTNYRGLKNYSSLSNAMFKIRKVNSSHETSSTQCHNWRSINFNAPLCASLSAFLYLTTLLLTQDCNRKHRKHILSGIFRDAFIFDTI
jgi:hypothetical protein